MVADANYLIDQCRIIGLQYKYTYGENIPLEQLIVRICDIKQYITQVGGTRPYGVGFLMAGYDKNLGYQMYTTDPAGAYNIWKAHAMGNNQKAADSVLKQDYKEDLDLSQGLDLALKALIKTMDTTSPAPNKIEIMTIVKDEETGEVKG
jgi:20S proteasome subunit alpha 3